jgi:hypothetical protein
MWDSSGPPSIIKGSTVRVRKNGPLKFTFTSWSKNCASANASAAACDDGHFVVCDSRIVRALRKRPVIFFYDLRIDF